MITIYPLSKVDVGNYSLILKVEEVDAPSYFSQYNLTFIIKDSNNTIDPSGEPPLNGKIKEVDTDGTITINFN